METGIGRASAQASFTARATTRAVAKAEASDPTVRYRTAEAQRIKVTPGITGLSGPSVHSDGPVWHLDVGSSHPGGGEAPKGLAVRQLKRYASWVQNVVRQFGLYPPWSFGYVREATPSTRGPEWTNPWCTCCHVSGNAG